jgi:hypothetical protein
MHNVESSHPTFSRFDNSTQVRAWLSQLMQMNIFIYLIPLPTVCLIRYMLCGSSDAVEDDTDTFIKSHLILLRFELHVDEWNISPFRTANQRATVLRRYFSTVEQSLLHREDSAAPKILRDGIGELEIPQVLDVYHVLAFNFTAWVLVGPEFELLIDVDDCLLGWTVHAVEVALEAWLQQLVALLQTLHLPLTQERIGVEGDEEDFSA